MTSLRFMCRFRSALQLGRTQWEDSRLRGTTESRLWCSVWATERERGDRKDRESSEWKRVTLICYSWSIYKIMGSRCWMFYSYLSGNAERLQSDQKLCTLIKYGQNTDKKWSASKEVLGSSSFESFGFALMSLSAFIYFFFNSTRIWVWKEGRHHQWHSILSLLD